MAIRIKTHGIERLTKVLNKLEKGAKESAEDALVGIGQDFMDKAQTLVPVVTGRLRSSAFVRAQARNKNVTDVHIGYETPYAIIVHEVQFDGHTTRGLPGAMRNGMGYKWLQRAAISTWPRALKKAISAIQAKIREA